MRFDELVIEKYGSRQSLTLHFPETPGLVVIYGPNEAGKSTCLSAISDFLFGIPTYSAHGQIFGNEMMRLTATLRRKDGERLTLRRRKGRGKTLTDRDGKLVDENILLALLGTTDRAKWSSLFGLNHESLREGGKRLLAAEGDVGRLIVEAGGGLRELVDQLAILNAQADQLFAPRKSSERAFYQALAAFETAEKSVRDGLVTREDYEQARREYADAKLALDKARQAQRTLNERQLEHQRLFRIVPMLAALEQIDKQIETFAELPTLRAEFAQEVREALTTRKLAQQAFDEAEKQRTNLSLEIEGLVASPELVAAEAQIRDILEKAKALVRQRADRPNRDKELATSEAKLAPLRRSVGVATDAELESLMPSEDVRANVQRLAAQGLELRPTIQSLTAQIADDTDALAGLEQHQSERARAGQDQPFGAPASEFDSLPKQSAILEPKRDQVGRAEKEIERRVRELGFATASELRALACPDAAVIQGELNVRMALETEQLKQVATLTTETARREAAVLEIERLRQDGEVPTDGAIFAARKERDAAWRPIKTAYLSEDVQALLALPLGQRGSVVEHMEKQIDEADDLADRKSSEATRIASLAVAEKQRDDADAAITAAKMTATELEKRFAQTRQLWSESWAEASQREVDLGRLKDLVHKRQEVLEIMGHAEASRIELLQLQAELDARLGSLGLVEQQLGLTVSAEASLAARVRIINQRITTHDEAYRSYRDDATRLNALRTQLKRKRTQLEELIKSEATWQQAWTDAARQLGLSEQVSPARANEVVTAWAAADGIFDGIRLTRRRLARMDDDESELRRMLVEITPKLNVELPEDPAASAHMLEEKWKEASKLASERSALLPQLKQRTHEAEIRRESLRAAEAEIIALSRQAQCAVSDLAEFADRHARWVGTKEKQRQLHERILTAGDGRPVDLLREQLGSRGLDEIQAALAEIEADAKLLDTELEGAAVRVEACKTKLGQFQSEQGYNQAVAERERAAAELHRIVEQYVELKLARELLTSGIENVREEQQDPLIKRAGELFSLTTGGTFTAVETDVDAKGNPVVVGKRGTNDTVAIDTMSDGTRDQLFLAFRLAHIEQYCAAAEPLPFIADDLLVHFDDARSTATLTLLAELGKTTQVLLFTHHRSVRETAATLAGCGNASFIELSIDDLKAA